MLCDGCDMRSASRSAFRSISFTYIKGNKIICCESSRTQLLLRLHNVHIARHVGMTNGSTGSTSRQPAAAVTVFVCVRCCCCCCCYSHMPGVAATVVSLLTFSAHILSLARSLLIFICFNKYCIMSAAAPSTCSDAALRFESSFVLVLCRTTVRRARRVQRSSSLWEIIHIVRLQCAVQKCLRAHDACVRASVRASLRAWMRACLPRCQRACVTSARPRVNDNELLIHGDARMRLRICLCARARAVSADNDYRLCCCYCVCVCG